VNFIVSTSGTDCLERLICEMTCYVFITYLLIYYTTCYSLGQQINSVDYLAISVDRSYGLRQGGYVFVLVCLYVGLPDRRITMDEFSQKVVHVVLFCSICMHSLIHARLWTRTIVD